jgi:hypothetical protein
MLRMMAFVVLVLSPTFMVLIVSYFVTGTDFVSEADALTIYGAEVQAFAVLLALAPIFFVFVKSQHPLPLEMKTAGLAAAIQMFGSFTGLLTTIAQMIKISMIDRTMISGGMITKSLFDISFLLMPFQIMTFVATMPILMTLLAAGALDGIIRWISKDELPTVELPRR